MKVLIILAALAACAYSLPSSGDAVTVNLKLYSKPISPMNRPPSPGGRIFGGTVAALNQFSWQAALRITKAAGNTLCGGSLISPQYVLTAAHCVVNATGIYALFGNNNRFYPQQNITAIAYSYHKYYNPANLNNDIASIKLAYAVTLSVSVSVIRLPTQSQATTTFENATAQVSGYGQTGTSSPTTSNLMFANLIIWSNANCTNIYGSAIIISSVVCATGNGASQGTCFGDSGGPLIIYESGTPTQIGVVSFVNSRGCEVPANGFTRTASHWAFISQSTGIQPRS